MKANESTVDRIIRAVAGVVLLFLGLGGAFCPHAHVIQGIVAHGVLPPRRRGSNGRLEQHAAPSSGASAAPCTHDNYYYRACIFLCFFRLTDLGRGP